MNMKEHILSALREQFDRWEGLLGSLSEAQITRPLVPSAWSTKDVMVHLWAWQQRSIARLEAASLDREPEFPVWLSGHDPDAEGEGPVEPINAWIYDTYRDQPWSRVHEDWRKGYLRFMELGMQPSEMVLLDGGKYPWLKGYSLALILLASYDHHQEHLEMLLAWLQEHGAA